MDLLPSKNSTNYYKGNLHGHSDHSDGRLNPQEVVNHYKKLGYNFTCLSDHLWKNKNFASDKVLDTSQYNDHNFITINSAEIHCKGKKYTKDGLWHIVANGLPINFKCADDNEKANSLIKRAIDTGAFVTIAHPEWYSLTFDEIMSVSNAHGVEIYNHSCHITTLRGFGTAVADFLLQENKRVVLTATDDSHFEISDAGGGWVMVAAENFSEKSILKSLKNGQFYSSTGVEIEKFQINNGIVEIECSPANHITIVGQGYNNLSKNGSKIKNASFDLNNFDSNWFRVTIIDCVGRYAWTNPIWL